ncbi:MAG: methyltransferase domain-containing protein [Chitinophagaceae bacterium]|nr:methyltransferase domain-containing protein [Chitinophagaceae bacterium]
MEKLIPEILRGKPCPVYCPICQANLNSKNKNSIKCLNGHRFDIADPGYINLLAKPYQSPHRDLISTGKALTENGLFDPLESELLQLLYAEYKVASTLTILDAGTGDGTVFSNMLLCMQWDQYRHQAIGLDNCSSAISMAATKSQSVLWLLADMAEIPLKNGSVDVILNIFAPCKYSEFYRVLRPGGLILKVIPGPLHLAELREDITDDVPDIATGFFSDYAADLKQTRVQYQKTLTRKEMDWLVSSGHSLPKKENDNTPVDQLQKLTIDCRILSGRKSDWAY